MCDISSPTPLAYESDDATASDAAGNLVAVSFFCIPNSTSKKSRLDIVWTPVEKKWEEIFLLSWASAPLPLTDSPQSSSTGACGKRRGASAKRPARHAEKTYSRSLIISLVRPSISLVPPFSPPVALGGLLSWAGAAGGTHSSWSDRDTAALYEGAPLKYW